MQTEHRLRALVTTADPIIAASLYASLDTFTAHYEQLRRGYQRGALHDDAHYQHVRSIQLGIDAWYSRRQDDATQQQRAERYRSIVTPLLPPTMAPTTALRVPTKRDRTPDAEEEKVASKRVTSAVQTVAVPTGSGAAVVRVFNTGIAFQAGAVLWALLADVHFHKDYLVWLAETCTWIISEVKRLGCQHVFLLGDTLHTRDNINHTSHCAAADLFRALLALPSRPMLHVLIGNHDMPNLKKRDVNAMHTFAIDSSRFHVYSEIEMIRIDGQQVLMVPFHYDQREIVAWLDAYLPRPEQRSDVIAMMHAAIDGARVNGFSHNRSGVLGTRIHSGGSLTIPLLSGFKRVFTGHFHTHVTYGNTVTQIGSPLQTTLNDVEDSNKGFVLYDPSSNTFELQRNPHAVHFESLTWVEANALVDASAPPADQLQRLRGKRVRIVASAHAEQRDVMRVTKNVRERYHIDGVLLAREQCSCARCGRRPSSPRAAPNTDADRIIVDDGSDDDNEPPATLDIPSLVHEYIVHLKQVESDAASPQLMDRREQAMLELASSDELQDRLHRPGGGGASSFRGALDTLVLQNFLCAADVTFNFADFTRGLWMLRGQNGNGKSTLLEGITWCLFGESLRGAAADDVCKRGARGPTVARLRFTNGVVVERQRRLTGSPKLTLRLADGTEVNKGRVVDTQQEIESLLGLTYETFVRTVMLGTGKGANFLNDKVKSSKIMNGKDKYAIIESLFGLDCLDAYYQHWVDANKTAETNLVECEKEAIAAQGAINTTQASVRQLDANEREQRALLERSFANRRAALEQRRATLRKDRAILLSRLEQRKPRLEQQNSWRAEQAQCRTLQQRAIDEENGLRATQYEPLRQEEEVWEQRCTVYNEICAADRLHDQAQQQLRTTQAQSQSLHKDRHLDEVLTLVRNVKERADTIAAGCDPVTGQLLQSDVIAPLAKLLHDHPASLQRVNEMRRLADSVIELTRIVERTAADALQLRQPHAWARDNNPDDQLKAVRVKMRDLQNQCTRLAGTRDAQQRRHEELQKLIEHRDEGQDDDDEQQRQLAILDHDIAVAEQQLRALPTELAIEKREFDNNWARRPEKAQFEAQLSVDNICIVHVTAQRAALNAEIDVARFWVAKLGRAKTQRNKNGFRSFCIARELPLFNRMLQHNMTILNQDADGMMRHAGGDETPIMCELTAELELVADETSIHIPSWSSGQRKRADLAVFFTMYTMAQSRSPFHGGFLFLDEVFDNLDRAGQLAAERWIAHTLLNGDRALQLVFLITHSEVHEGGNHHQLVVPRRGHYEAIVAPSHFAAAETAQPTRPLIIQR